MMMITMTASIFCGVFCSISDSVHEATVTMLYTIIQEYQPKTIFLHLVVLVRCCMSSLP